KPVVTDPTQAWVDQHPEGKDFDAAAPVAELPVQPDADTEAPTDTPAPDAATPDVPVTPDDVTPPATPAEPTAPQAQAPTEPLVDAKPAGEPKPATPAATPEPTRLSLEGKYFIADGNEPWTGAQVIEGLRERATEAPLVAEAQGFREFFGADLEKAKEAWTPMLDALRSRPERIRFLEEALEKMPDDKFQYLLESSQYWDTQTPAAVDPAAATPAQPTAEQPKYAQLDPQTKARLERFEQVQAEREAATEWNAALTEFPILNERPDLRNSLIELFNAMYQRDPSTRLENALRINRPMYQAITVALANQAPPAEATPVVPALNGSPGAAPGGTRARTDTKPKAFQRVDDAVDDWLKTHPS